MINSMTGFGRSEHVNDERKIVVEIKAVNHRFCDMNIKLPKRLNYFEADIRGCLKEYIQRGKVDVFITYEDYTKPNVCVKYNREIASEYMTYLTEMAEQFGMQTDMKPSVIGRYPEVFTLEEQTADDSEVWKYLEAAVREAAENFTASRAREGENLRKDLTEKLAVMAEHVAYIEERSPQIIEDYKARLIEKVDELAINTQFDDQRIAAEVTMYADKVCVDEELVRLKSHIDSTGKILTEGGAVGRKLDFLVQEMNREANTILSKAGSLDISDRGIELKTEIEKIREQIQNIE